MPTLHDQLDEVSRKFRLGSCVIDTNPENPFAGWVVGWRIRDWHVDVDMVGYRGRPHAANPLDLKIVSRADVDRVNGVKPC